MTLENRVQNIRNFIQSLYPLIVIETVEEERVENLLKEVTAKLNYPLCEWSVTTGLGYTPGTKFAPQRNPYQQTSERSFEPIQDTDNPLEVLKYIDQNVKRTAIFWLKDFGQYFSDPKILRKFREIIDALSKTHGAIVLTGNALQLPKDISHEAIFYDLQLPDRDELYDAVCEEIRYLKVRRQVMVELAEEQRWQLVKYLEGMTLKQARQVITYAALADGILNVNDFPRIIHRKVQILREEGLLEYIPLEENRAQLGGFIGLKKWLARAKVGFSPQAQALNLPSPKGILIVGIQGCGKSLAAKTIAKEWKLPLLKLDAGRLYDKFVGESEKNFHRVVALAESMSPAILWIDEIEKSFGQGGDGDGGISQRLFGSFLTWLQEKSKEVFVIATANDLSKIPPELLRKGRFDEIFFVDLPSAQERAAILTIHLKFHCQNPGEFDLPMLVKATSGYSGAEIQQAIITALYNALYLKQPLTTALLLEEIKSTIPLSVSRKEDVAKLQAIARHRFVSVK